MVGHALLLFPLQTMLKHYALSLNVNLTDGNHAFKTWLKVVVLWSEIHVLGVKLLGDWNLFYSLNLDVQEFF